MINRITSLPWDVIAARLSAWDRKVFWTKIHYDFDHLCWPWTGHRNKQGYGLYKPCGGSIPPVLAHRVVYGLTFGRINHEMLILHSCDNPPCCNPKHLREGTHDDNMNDMVVRGRSFHPPRRSA